MKALILGAMVLLLLTLFLQCGPSTTTEGPSLTPEVEEIPTVPANTPSPSPEVWMIKGATSRSHGLWSEECLTDEFGAKLITQLHGGTRITPAGQGCHRAEWDTGDPAIHPGGPYVYCHVRVLDGRSEGEIGWVKEDFIDK